MKIIKKTEKSNEEMLIQQKFHELLDKASHIIKEQDREKITKAFTLSYESHKGMTRKTGEAYIFHPLDVAIICAEEIGLGATSIICALLHDVVEDTHISLEDIEKEFGVRVAKIIDGLTKTESITNQDLTIQEETFNKIIKLLSFDVRGILVKLADRLHNMRTLNGMKREKQLKIANETKFIYAPLSHRLGLNRIKEELEDLYLKYNDPKAFEEIEKKLQKSFKNRNEIFISLKNKIENEIENMGYAYRIINRVKSIYSIWLKMHTKGICFEEIYDLFAVRIILNVPFEKSLDHELKACLQVYSIISKYFQPKSDRFRDWISAPKTNGYQSLHTTVMSEKAGHWVEIQIRTTRMDEIAERGYAAHWMYKSGNNAYTNSGLEKWLDSVRDLLKNEKLTHSLFENFKPTLYEEEISVFTRAGEKINIPKGASVLDMAFNIDETLGFTCTGAKVDNKIVSHFHRLHEGNQVEILKSKKPQQPSEEWLENVVSTQAISAIKIVLLKEKEKLRKIGKNSFKNNFNDTINIYNKTEVKQLLDYFQMQNLSDFYEYLGKGKINAIQMKRILQSFPNKRTPNSNEENKKYTICPVCKPLVGDEVFGIETKTNEIEIHRTNCKFSVPLLANKENKIIANSWINTDKYHSTATLHVEGTDRSKMILDVSSLISKKFKGNMLSMDISQKDGVFKGIIKLKVDDTMKLEKIMTHLSKINGINRVTRAF